ncbi:MAG: hypothetical protein ACTSV7_06835 [Candidatus Baldrarchaeia archaeon]
MDLYSILSKINQHITDLYSLDASLKEVKPKILEKAKIQYMTLISVHFYYAEKFLINAINTLIDLKHTLDRIKKLS